MSSDEPRKQFGNRFLTATDNLYKHNAWDNVEWDNDQKQVAEESVKKNSETTLPVERQIELEEKANVYWDSFYDIHQNRFFKDRQWLFTEFPELKRTESSDGETSINMFEIGCGVGNTILPILRYNDSKLLKVYGCDFSENAIDILQKHAKFDSARSEVFVLDATLPEWKNVPFEKNSLDIIIIIFVMSAIHPENMQNVLNNCFEHLKPGGLVLFRDYGRYDLTQLRFKPGKCIQENFYVRGDGTRVYFFTEDEIEKLFEQSGFEKDMILVDRRLQVNRGKLLKMYRVWIQAKFRKPINLS